MVNGVTKLSHTFAASITDGPVGLATWNAVSHFDDVLVQSYVSGMMITGDAGPTAVDSWTDSHSSTLSLGPSLPPATPAPVARELPAGVVDYLFADRPSREGERGLGVLGTESL